MGNVKAKKWLCHGLVLAMSLSLMPAVPDSSAAKKKAKLAMKKITITQGKSKKIVIKNKKKKATYKFTASNKKIKVTKAGKVKAIKVGKAKVVVKETYKKKTRKVGTVTVTIKKMDTGTVTSPSASTGTDNPKPTTNNNGTVPTPTATATATPGVTPGPTNYTVSDETYQKMVTDSLYSTGNNARLKAVIEKARAGEDVTLAYIGGSITEGALAKPNSNCYAEVSAKAFGKKYGKNDGEKVHFINAGMSGTPSDLGVVRYNRDVINRLPVGDHPDILFIEFAVNDYGCETKGGGYEGLIRQALKSGSAVVLIFSVFKGNAGGRVCEMEYRPFGACYDLPMISMGDSIMSYFKESGFYKWYFGDDLHPNNTGYQLMSDCIMNLMDTVDKETAEADNITDVDAITPHKTAAYQGIKILDSSTDFSSDAAIGSVDAGGFSGKDTATGSFQYEYNGQKSAPWFPDNWMHTSTSDWDSLKVTLTCKTLMLVYKKSNAKSFGKADLYIDGKKNGTIDCYDTTGWNNGAVYLALTEDAAKSHDIELKMADGDEGKNFTLMAIGYN